MVYHLCLAHISPLDVALTLRGFMYIFEYTDNESFFGYEACVRFPPISTRKGPHPPYRTVTQDANHFDTPTSAVGGHVTESSIPLICILG
jgi:hypothetical protein